MSHLQAIAEQFDNARALSAIHTLEYLTTWLYLVTYPSGRRGWWVRFTSRPENRVDGFDVELVAGFRAGRQTYPD